MAFSAKHPGLRSFFKLYVAQIQLTDRFIPIPWGWMKGCYCHYNMQSDQLMILTSLHLTAKHLQ